MDSRTFANRLSAIRHERGMTQEELAKASELSTNNISNYERAVVMPTLVNAERLADALDCSIDVLAGRVDLVSPNTTNGK